MRPSIISLVALSLFLGLAYAGGVEEDKRDNVCTVKANGKQKDDVPNLLRAFNECGNGGTIIFPEDQSYWIGARLNPVLNDVSVQWRGKWTFSDNFDYWRNNSFPVAFQNHRAGFLLVDSTSPLMDTVPEASMATAIRDIPQKRASHNLDRCRSSFGTSMKLMSGTFVKDPPLWSLNIINGTNMRFNSIYCNATSVDAPYGHNWFADTMDAVNIQPTNFVYQGGDDCIAIKPRSYNIDIEDVTCVGGNGIAIGSLDQYLEDSNVENVRVDKLNVAPLQTDYCLGIGNLIRSALLDPQNKDEQLHFYSSSGGNAGLAAVIAARDLGYPCTVVVPFSTKPMMINKLWAAGAADVIQHGASWSDADTYLRKNYIYNQDTQHSSRRNIYLCPYDHPEIWKGAATMVSEMVDQLPPRDPSSTCNFPADAIVCSVGGGGLFNGIVEGVDSYLQSQAMNGKGNARRNVKILAAETHGADSLALSLQHGSLQSLPGITSLATSLGAVCVAEKTFQYASSPPAGIDVASVVGSDAEAARGVLRLADDLRLQVELACGISVEVAVGGRLRNLIPDLTPNSRVVIVVCGGSNITAEMIAEYRHQLESGWI
ncbi:hypothetical protein KXW40_007702 [Aspergillus fumigatus]|nr:hypothetical protein KXW40_007702 [Aspergillus fumigatus]